jgi:hypothetical protein
MSVYGPIITGTDVRHALVKTIQLWIDSYLGEVANQHERPRDALPSFRSYKSSAQKFQYWPETQLPACIIVVPGTADGTVEKHSGKYSVEFPVGIGVLCSSIDQDSTNELVELYTAAIRGLILQHASLGGFAVETWWIGESYNELTADKSRSLAGGSVNLGVRVDAVLDSMAGLAVPPEDPIAQPDDPPVVISTGVNITATPPFSDQEIDV